MLLFVGLGNPGSKYLDNRHNVGFMAVDEIVRCHNFLPERKKFQALVSEGKLNGEPILVLKPQTFMNESGRSVGEAMRFYKLSPEDVVVFYDELDLPFAKVKVKQGGGLAGHNGLKSIKAHIGENFHRVRIGIGHPGHRDKVTSHVLGDFAKSEWPEIEEVLDGIAREASWLAKRDGARFQTALAQRLTPQRPSTGTKKPAGAPSSPTDETKQKAAAPKPAASYSKKVPDGPMADMLRSLKTGDK
ncbi:peptidyl-tRNA hydrolase [Kordiimonas sediminis]|uniref:Peptidyl-tRNA hydrolase n=1 Tax=Kordiimonas sediminis TaxID=1735581 RepID=A0A919E6G2_9PROT|nr:aminoacyl-tRNA hydrolase [Kordiimonas sediminis]GHF18801.1 peptidyl-tRNA hydrolase [Kordiimonas sediminis]